MSAGAKVVALHNYDDVARMLRQLADDVDAGRVHAAEVLCVVRTGTDSLQLYSWGEFRGTIAAIGLLESAKKCVPVHEG